MAWLRRFRTGVRFPPPPIIIIHYKLIDYNGKSAGSFAYTPPPVGYIVKYHATTYDAGACNLVTINRGDSGLLLEQWHAYLHQAGFKASIS